MEKGEEHTPHQTSQTWGAYTGKTSLQNIWLCKPDGLNFTSFYNQWGLTSRTLKMNRLNSGRQRARGN